jgi:hypothetical protein
MSTAAAILITIPLSHYCEKARWALDRVALRYREEPHAPLLHRLATKGDGGGTVPVLLHGGRRLNDSTAILVYADEVRGAELLYPRDATCGPEVAALEEKFDTQLGPHSRRRAYAELLSQPKLLRSLWSRGVPPHEALSTSPMARRTGSTTMVWHTRRCTDSAPTGLVVKRSSPSRGLTPRATGSGSPMTRSRTPSGNPRGRRPTEPRRVAHVGHGATPIATERAPSCSC